MSLLQQSGTGTRSAAFEKAAQHTRLVKRLRRILPVLALVMGVVFFSLSYIRSLLFRVELGTLKMDGTSLILQKPRLEGYDRFQRAYSVTAESAKQSVTNFHEVQLTNIVANMELVANGWAKLTSAKGELNSETEHVRLYDGVNVTTSQGYAMTLQDMLIDSKDGTMKTDKGVKAVQGENVLTADRLNISQSGGIIRFEGHVHLDIGAAGKPLPQTGATQ